MNKKKKYEHLDQAKRDRLQAMLDGGLKQNKIAEVLKVDPSTICREIERNRRKIRKKGGTIDGRYQAAIAEHKALVRRENSKYQGMKIEQERDLRKYVIEKLRKHWNPDEISGKMKKEKRPLYASKTAIYEWLRSSYGQFWCRYLYSQRYRVRKQNPKKTERVLIPKRIGIELRPRGATNRSRYGHWETDTMVSGKKTKSKAALSVIYERKAKYIDARKIKNLKPMSNVLMIKEMFASKKALSATEDNGIENTRHEELGIPVYFCDPYSSWQKGGVENANKMIRRFIPKGADLNDYSDEYVKILVDVLNNKPRKSLGYKTPYEVMTKNKLFKKTNLEKIALEG